MTTQDAAEDHRAVLEDISGDEIAELALRLVRVPGENPPGAEGPRVEVLADACTSRGLWCEIDEVEPGRPNLYSGLSGGEGPGLLVLGHTDVVPVGEGWEAGLRNGVIRDGRLYGRGSADMLGGLAAVVVALGALRRAGVPLSGPVELAAVMDEEETGHGIRHYVATRRQSAWAGCVVTEPTDLQTIIAARGDSYLEIDVAGRAAHSGNPADGANAIYGASTVVSELERWHEELAALAHPLVGPATFSVGRIDGGTGTSIVPARCDVAVDRRLLPGEDPAKVHQEVISRLDRLQLSDRGLSLTVRQTMEMPGFETPPGHPFVQLTSRAVPAAGGPQLPLGGWTAACDGGFVARDLQVPVVVLGPGSVTGQAHRANESVALDELLVAARTYALIALRLLAG